MALLTLSLLLPHAALAAPNDAQVPIQVPRRPSTAAQSLTQGGVQDSVFLRDLSQVASYVFDGPQLVLNMRFSSGNMIFAPQSPTALTGPAWRVTNFNNGMQGVVSTVPGTQLTMMFSEDGAISGSAGCNRYTGSYTLSGSSISFGPIATTLMACLDEDVTRQEQQFLAALMASTTFDLVGDRLTLRDNSGATQIVGVRPTVEPPP